MSSTSDRRHRKVADGATWASRSVIVAVLFASGCAGEATPRTQETTVDASGSASSPTDGGTSGEIDGMFDVGGHSLYMTCRGTDAPTVIYFHGYIENSSFEGHSSALAIQELLAEDHRVCLYDRANVGRSDPVEGPLSAESSVADLEQLLAAAEVEPPYVLLPASFGGLIADVFAAEHPDDVVGMVQLDASLPDTIVEIDERFYPPDQQIQPDAWVGTTELIDQLATYSQARERQESLPPIPMTYIRSNEGPTNPAEVEALAEMIDRFVGRFAPGTLLQLDVPHYMEVEIPERIAQEVELVIEQADG